MTAGVPSSAEELQAQIAEVLDEPADSFGPDDDLIDVGLDSIRLMSLVERWRSGGVRLGFVELADQPTVNGWWSLMTAQKEDVIR
ncbi:phosphopantetheine-binding protein [Micromonospora sp. WMMD1076]|uniref:phosphopantetheine-binding protein n=1 Tax=Micromonospora TaxID=1873 RepID=UPI00249B7A5D|nr:phosphopantetheine-binding protein [Micromonospora sp. WMMD1076]WFF04673.1 phosphopantetheine-binding protein [Micromonospora sp. WMMD1076]